MKRILNKFGYPPNLQEEAVKTVLKRAELLCVGREQRRVARQRESPPYSAPVLSMSK